MEEVSNKEAANTMIMLDMEVRQKIREVILDMVTEPKDEEERNFVETIIASAENARHQRIIREQTEHMNQLQLLQQLQSARSTTQIATAKSRGLQPYQGWSGMYGRDITSDRTSYEQSDGFLGKIKKTFF